MHHVHAATEGEGAGLAGCYLNHYGLTGRQFPLDAERRKFNEAAAVLGVDPEERQFQRLAGFGLDASGFVTCAADFDQGGAASLPCSTLELFSLDPELVRMNRQIHYHRDPSTSEIHCGDLHRRRCIAPDCPLDR